MGWGFGCLEQARAVQGAAPWRGERGSPSAVTGHGALDASTANRSPFSINPQSQKAKNNLNRQGKQKRYYFTAKQITVAETPQLSYLLKSYLSHP